MNLQQIHELIGTVEGWLTEWEGELLFRLAQTCSPAGAIVEIGSWQGKSAIWLAHGSRQGPRTPVYAIDPHVGSPEHQLEGGPVWTFDAFQRNIARAGVDDLVRPILKTSAEAARSFDQPVALIFIDGAHEYEAVHEDIALWYPKLIEGGIMACHDTAYRPPKWRGTARAVEEAIYRSSRFRKIGRVDSITFAEKVGRASLAEQLANRRALLAKYAYERNLEERLRQVARAAHVPPSLRLVGKKLVGLVQ